MSFSNNRSFEHIKNLFQKGYYEEVKQSCTNLKKAADISDEEKITLDNFILLALVKLRNKKEALKLADNIIKQSDYLKRPQEKIEALVSKARILISYRQEEKTKTGKEKLEEALEIVEKLTDISEEDKISYLARIYETQGMALFYEKETDEAFNYFMKSLEESQKSNNAYYEGVAYYNLGLVSYYLGKKGERERKKFLEKSLEIFKEIDAEDYIHQIDSIRTGDLFNKGELKKASEIIEKNLDYYKKTKNDYEIAKSFHFLGMIYGRTDLDKALEKHEKSKEIFKKNAHHHDEARSYLEISGILRRKGNYNEALDALSQYYKIKVELDDKECVGIAHNRIGEILLIKGELGFAEDHFEKALAIAEELNVKRSLALLYSNLGDIKYKKGLLREAEEYYSKALGINEELDLDRSIADSLHKLLVVHLDSKSLGLAKNDLSKLRKITKKSQSVIVKQTYSLSEALYLRDFGKEIELNKAKVVLEQLINENFTDYMIKVEVLLNLCKLLLIQSSDAIAIEQEKSVLEELETYVKILSETAEKHDSISLKVETLILQSHLVLLKSGEGIVGVAQQHLKKAQMIAENKELLKLSKKISNELDLLTKQPDKYVEPVERFSRFEEKLDQIIKKKI